MTARCPAGHASDESDYCSVCGAAIAPAAVVAPAAVRTFAGAPGPGCPVCGEPRTDGEARFCEVCRFDFVSGAPGPAPLAPVAAASASAKVRWELVVTVDPTLDTEPDPATPPPKDGARVFPLDGDRVLVGRRDDKQKIHPQLTLHDPGASRKHVEFVRGGDGAVFLHDLGSTNGTKRNGAEVPSGATVPLAEGDEISLGRWTRIRLRVKA